MRVLILCGGQGIRLAPVLNGLPKALAPINGKPFLDYQLEALFRAGFVDIVLCTGVGHDQIAAHVRSHWGTTIQLSHEPYPSGTAGALRYARGWVQDTVLVVNGDTFVDVDHHAMITWHRLWRSAVTVAVAQRPAFDTDGQALWITGSYPQPGRQILGSGRIIGVVSASEICDHRSVMVNAGLCVLDPDVLSVIPDHTMASLDQDTLPVLLRRQVPCWAYADRVEFFDIGTPERLDAAPAMLDLLIREGTRCPTDPRS